MSKMPGKSKTWSVVTRLQFIDFILYWEGQINRKDIMERFGISTPQASKDLADYKDLAPGNLDYHLSEKRYCASRSFKPVFFIPDANAYLTQMRDDVSSLSPFGEPYKPDLPAHDIVRTPRRHIDPEILRCVVTAIRRREACDIIYQSMSSSSSGEPEARTISPHALVFDGLRWHARGYCHKREVFRDFLLARILRSKISAIPARSTEKDKEWHTVVTISLIPHPQLTASQADAVARDFNMVDHRLDIPTREAFVYYLLHRLNLSDCDGRKNNPGKQHVVIADPDVLRGQYNSENYPS